jgi:hypothetical protein
MPECHTVSASQIEKTVLRVLNVPFVSRELWQFASEVSLRIAKSARKEPLFRSEFTVSNF